jgi:hypothetical protein
LTFEEFDHLASALSALATIAALVVGGAWTYQRFVRTREANPKVEFEVSVEFVARQNGFWIAEALAFLDNKGLVRHDITNFTFSVRFLLSTDSIEAKEEFLAFVPHDGGSGSWIPPDWGNTFIEPGLRTRYSALIRVPAEASAVLIHGKFYYTDGDWHTSDKLVPVPAFSKKMSPKDSEDSSA